LFSKGKLIVGGVSSGVGCSVLDIPPFWLKGFAGCLGLNLITRIKVNATKSRPRSVERTSAHPLSFKISCTTA
jgi:hypothetical protein